MSVVSYSSWWDTQFINQKDHFKNSIFIKKPLNLSIDLFKSEFFKNFLFLVSCNLLQSFRDLYDNEDLWKVNQFSNSQLVITFSDAKLYKSVLQNFSQVLSIPIRNRHYYYKVQDFASEDYVKISLKGIPVGYYENEKSFRDFLYFIEPNVENIVSSSLDFDLVGRNINSGHFLVNTITDIFLSLKKK